MSSQDEYMMNNWNARYYATGNTDYSNYKEYLAEQLRLADINETYKMMERPRVLHQLKAIRSDMMARGSCTIDDPPPDPEVMGKKEEDEEEFLFDPKELDI